MNMNTCSVSTCRSCRYYTPEGRRGGQCQQLSAPVCGSWKSCSLAFPPFAPSWEHLEKLISLDSHESVPARAVPSKSVPVKAQRVSV